jgi:hypothetical protein
MGLEVQTVTVSFNECAIVTFSATIQQYVAGISGFYLDYGSGIYHMIQTLTVGVNVVSVSGNRITVAPLLLMTNGTGNYVDPDSCISITILAYTGSVNNDSLLLVNNAQDPVTLPASPLTVLPILTGFSLGYADNNEHNIGYISAATGVIQNPYSVSVTGNGSMFDSSHHYANPATVSTGLIVNCDPGLNLTGAAFNGLGAGTYPNNPNKGAFLTGFYFFFGGSDSDVCNFNAYVNIDGNQTITVGANSWWNSKHRYMPGLANVAIIDF